MGVALAKTTFTDGADKSLAVESVYTKRDTDVINQSVALDPAQTDNSLLSSAQGALSALTSGKPLITAADIEKNVLAVNPDAFTAFKSLSSQFQGYLTAPQAMYNRVQATIHGVEKTITGTAQETVKAVSSLVSNVFGVNCTPTFKDVNSTITFTLNLLGLCKQMHLTDALNCILQSPHMLKDVFKGVIKSLIPKIVFQGDLFDLLHLSSSQHAASVSQTYPMVVPDFIRNYAISDEIKPEAYAQTYFDAVGAFDRVDPNWRKYQMASSELPSAKYLMQASEDFLTIWQAAISSVITAVPNPQGFDPGFDKWTFLAAKTMSVQPTKATLRSQYPGIIAA